MIQVEQVQYGLEGLLMCRLNLIRCLEENIGFQYLYDLLSRVSA